MAPAPKELRFNMMMAEDEREMLRKLADAEGMSESAMVRKLIRDASRAALPAPKKKPRK
jgi:hypothetical protein